MNIDRIFVVIIISSFAKIPVNLEKFIKVR